MLQAKSYQVGVLFEDKIQYVVPPYQRNYVWTSDKWERLWRDIREAAERPDRAGHFLGTIVIRQEPDEPGGPKQRTIVDGQQRLTTIHVILSVLRDLARADSLGHLLERVRALTLNAEVASEYELKVIPSLVDLEVFRGIVAGGDQTLKPLEDPPLTQAYRHFRAAVGAYVRSSPRPAGALETLLRTLCAGLYLVMITLTEADDEQAIFERLNSSGEPLRSSELIRNHVLHRRHKRDLVPPRSTYEEYWIRLDDLPPARVDAFLRSYLSMQKGRGIAEDRLFVEFRDHVAAREDDLTGLLKEIVRAGEVFESILTGRRLAGYERRFAAHLRAMRTYAFMPVLLKLFLTYDDEAQRGPALAVLDSYLLRRYVCRRSTKSYPDLVPELLRSLTAEADPAARLHAFLSGLTGSRAWPTDDQVSAAIRLWDTRGPGRTSDHKRVAKELILLAEVQLSTSHVEPVEFDPAVLTVEHLMPQAWRDVGWPISAVTGDLTAAERQERDRVIHTLGNLTLVTKDLNQFLGDKPWAEKYPHLRESRLQLNRGLPPDFSDAAHIATRSDQVAGLLCAALPSPDGAATMPVALAAMPTDDATVGEPVEVFTDSDEFDGEDLNGRAFDEDEHALDEDEPALGDDADTGNGNDADTGNDPDTDTDPDPGPGNDPGPGPGNGPITDRSGGGWTELVDVGSGVNGRIRTALGQAGGGPLTYREIAASCGIRARQVKWLLTKRAVSRVSTTTKDGLIAGVLVRR